MFEAGHLFFHRPDLGEHIQRFVAHAQFTFKGWLLFEQTYAKPAKQDNFSAVGFFLPGDEAKDCRLAGAVAADEPHPLTRIYLKGDRPQDFGRTVGFVDVVEPEKHLWEEGSIFHFPFFICH